MFVLFDQELTFAPAGIRRHRSFMTNQIDRFMAADV
jgi:hypothetical protein